LSPGSVPAISGNQLIRLLIRDGWQEGRHGKHGMTLTKKGDDRTRVTLVPTTDSSLPKGTLMAILNEKQTGLGRKGFLELLSRAN